jgi:hypothetical protein
MRFEAILEWFSGKARDTIVNFTIPAIVESEEQGFWKKGVARTVRASLNKQNVAKSVSKAMDAQLGEHDPYSGNGRTRLRYDHPLYNGAADMLYGSFERAARHLTAEAKAKRDAQGEFMLSLKPGSTVANATIERWAQAFAPVAELLARLDATRPKPVYVMKTLSPTVAENITAHIGIDVSTIRIPDMHGEYIEIEFKGEKCRVYQIVVDWPEDTLHHRSRFMYSAKSNSLCEACGHAIKDPYNWCPLLAYGTDGKTPYSLWVGRDCASKLFGCKVEGDAIYKR